MKISGHVMSLLTPEDSYPFMLPSYLLQVRAFYIDSNGLFTSVMTRGGNPVSLNNNIGLRTVFEGQLFYIGCVATLISNGKVSTSVEWIGFYIGYQSIDVECGFFLLFSRNFYYQISHYYN